MLSLSGEGHFETLNSVIEVTLDVMKEKNILSSHSLPQIRNTNELKSFNVLLFPGKIASYVKGSACFIGVADTGHHRILIIDDHDNVQVRNFRFKDYCFIEVSPHAILCSSLSEVWILVFKTETSCLVNLKRPKDSFSKMKK